MKNGLFAVINIGTSAFRMEIGSFLNGEYKQIEYLVKSLSLGKDTFANGFISSASIHEAYDILSKFKEKMNEYKISNKFEVVATSGVREAKNRDFFVDFMNKKLGMKIEVLTPYEELYIRYIGIKNEFERFNALEKGGVALVNVSSGNVSIVIVKNKTILYADSLRFGSLRLNEIFKDLDEKNKVYAYNRYIESMISGVEYVISEFKIKNVVFSGSSINILREIFSPSNNCLTQKDVEFLFNEIKKKSVDFIKDRFSIRHNEAEVLKPMVCVYLNILRLFETDLFCFSKTTFPRKLLMYYSKSYKQKNLKEYLEKTILNIGEKYNFDKKHALYVRDSALKLFDILQNQHLLDKKHKQLLEIAALLHDVGYYVNEENHEEHSYYIINSLHLPQIGEKESRIIALIALLHKEKDTDVYLRLYHYLSQEDIFMLKKLVSLLRIADALDASHKQLIKKFSVKLDKNSVKIKLSSDNFIFFEMVSLKKKARLFEELFGIKIEAEQEIE